MPNSVAVAIGGLIAAEATGITNFSGSGGGSAPTVINTGGGGTPIPMPSPDRPGPGGGDNSGGGGGFQSDLFNRINERLNNQEGAIQNLADKQGSNSGENTSDTVINYIRDKAPDTPNTPSPTNAGGYANPSVGLTARQKAALASGRDPFGLQAMNDGYPAQIAEGLRATGETVNGITSSVGSPATSFGDKPREDTLMGFSYEAGQSAGAGINTVSDGIGSVQDRIYESGQNTGSVINDLFGD